MKTIILIKRNYNFYLSVSGTSIEILSLKKHLSFSKKNYYNNLIHSVYFYFVHVSNHSLLKTINKKQKLKKLQSIRYFLLLSIIFTQ
jgi:uncharacterized membrane protein